MTTSPAEREPSVFELQPDRVPGGGADGSLPTPESGDPSDEGDEVDDPSDELIEPEASANEPVGHGDSGNEDEAADPDDDGDDTGGLQSPAAYLAELCGLHQIVLLGDNVGVRQHIELLAEMLVDLYEAGVTNLAWEFTNSRAQEDLDRLTTSVEWDERLCADLFVDLLGVGFAYREYAEVLRAVWRLNRSRPPGAPAFRVVALGVPSYVEDPELLDGRSAGELELRNWWMGGHYRDLTAFHMANVLTTEVIRRGRRALVYCDAARTTTRLVQWDDGLATTSVGNLLHRWMGEGVQRVVFHGAIHDTASIERVEALIEAAPEDVSSLGIDLELSTLGNVGVTDVVGSTDGSQTSFRLRELADGYLFVAPRREWLACRLLEDLVTPANFIDVEARYRALDPRDEPYSLDELEEVRVEGQALLSNAWPQLPEPEEEPVKKGRFRRR